ncbi:MAG: hypothetical protein AABY83_09430 [Pseudomonadota bacterium]|mgnify:CR=1 FL=1
MRRIAKGLLSIVFGLSVLGYPERGMAWTQGDSWWEGAYLILHVMDWGQTRDISTRCRIGEYRELNPVLGACPATQRVNQYFLATAALHAGLTYVLPTDMRRMFQVGTIGLQFSVVNSNAQIGLNIAF